LLAIGAAYLLWELVSCEENLYRQLSLSRHASDRDVKATYKNIALALHPDKSSAPDAQEKFTHFKDGVEILMDAEKRNIYNRYGFAGLANDPRLEPITLHYTLVLKFIVSFLSAYLLTHEESCKTGRRVLLSFLGLAVLAEFAFCCNEAEIPAWLGGLLPAPFSRISEFELVRTGVEPCPPLTMLRHVIEYATPDNRNHITHTVTHSLTHPPFPFSTVVLYLHICLAQVHFLDSLPLFISGLCLSLRSSAFDIGAQLNTVLAILLVQEDALMKPLQSIYGPNADLLANQDARNELQARTRQLHQLQVPVSDVGGWRKRLAGALAARDSGFTWLFFFALAGVFHLCVN